MTFQMKLFEEQSEEPLLYKFDFKNLFKLKSLSWFLSTDITTGSSFPP